MNTKTIYIVVATNMYGVDKTPIAATNAKTAHEKMMELFLWGIDNHSSLLCEFDNEFDYDYENTFEIIAADKLDEFLDWLSKRDYVNLEPTRMRIPVNDEDSLDNFEVNIFKTSLLN